MHNLPVILDDSSLRSQIGGIGNEIHNLSCEHQNNEKLSDRLSDLSSRLWKLAQESPKESTRDKSDIKNAIDRYLKAVDEATLAGMENLRLGSPIAVELGLARKSLERRRNGL